ncbi:hypothetical protein SUGI_1055500 [Cryptomeria japonica]|nr:hypothetical protein SUGI_1055500 [Cryptomeria japonica]
MVILFLTAVIAAVLTIVVCVVWFKVSESLGHCQDGGERPLPPGSMGLPFIGETLEYLTPFKSNSMGPFLHKRISRYGKVFKTNLFGRPTIISTSAEANQFIFQNEGRLFKCAYPAAFVNIVGKNNIVQVHGPMHKKLRQLSLTLIGHKNLESNLVEQVEMQVLQTLHTWKDGSIIQLKDEVSKIPFNMLMNQFVGFLSETVEAKELLTSFSEFMEGLFSFPIKLPGTTYSKCLKGRGKVLEYLEKAISQRRKERRVVKEDFLDIVLGEADKTGDQFSDEKILDFLFALLLAGYDTVSTAITMAVKFLTETNKALCELREEHEALIHRKIKKGESSLNWEDYKSMTFTRNVIKEAIRLSNIGPYLHRECTQDVEINGFKIPKGWKVIACTTAVNLDPSVYSDPLSFDPWRWNKMKENGSHFQAFGGGSRYCVGSELAKLEMAVFLHHFVTKFRWEKKDGNNDDLVRCPLVLFENGYPINVRRRALSSSLAPTCSKEK